MLPVPTVGKFWVNDWLGLMCKMVTALNSDIGWFSSKSDSCTRVLFKWLVMYSKPNVCHRERHLHLLETGNISLLQVQDRTPGAPPRAAALRVGSTEQLAQLVEISKHNTLLYAASPMTGPDLYWEKEKDASGSFWLLEESKKDAWDAMAAEDAVKFQGHLRTGLAPVTTDSNWIDVVLDAILNRRLSTDNMDVVEESQRYSVILASLFPHLAHFTPAQNSALLDIILDKHWSPEGAVREVWTLPGVIQFRLKKGTTLLFGHGKPSENLLVQLVGRCMGWSLRPYDELFTLFEHVAFPIQQHWPDIAGTRILDTIFLLYVVSAGKPVPYDKVFQLAATSPMACKHLLPAIVSICLKYPSYGSAHGLLILCDMYGATFDAKKTEKVIIFLIATFAQSEEVKIFERLKTILGSDGGPFKIEVADPEWDKEKLKKVMLAALKRLDNPPIPIQIPGEPAEA
ncbi:hypothetical protein K438DRAFT_2054673 [Mycena galopus ATCC 62051]|nr:hypothetical protein K438DRAFT_2054673 [Mycena galopus ATCC 62051]